MPHAGSFLATLAEFKSPGIALTRNEGGRALAPLDSQSGISWIRQAVEDGANGPVNSYSNRSQ